MPSLGEFVHPSLLQICFRTTAQIVLTSDSGSGRTKLLLSTSTPNVAGSGNQTSVKDCGTEDLEIKPLRKGSALILHAHPLVIMTGKSTLFC